MVVWPGATWSTADVARGWANGLEACGVDVVRFRLDERVMWLSAHLDDDELKQEGMGANVRRMASEMLAGALYEYRPDWLVVVDGKDIPPEVWSGMRKRGQRIVLVHTESPYEDDRVEAMHWCADWHLVNDPSGVDRLTKHTQNVAYTPHCYDPVIHHPGTGTTPHDVVFVGSGFAGRAKFLAEVDWHRAGHLTLAGQWRLIPNLDVPPVLEPFLTDLPEPLPNEDAADLYRTSKVGLNLYRADYLDRPESANGWAMGPREVEMAACGLFFLRQPRPEGDTVLPMLPTFGSPEELTDQAEWWLAHPKARKEAAAASLAAVADRTFDRQAALLLSRVG